MIQIILTLLPYYMTNREVYYRILSIQESFIKNSTRRHYKFRNKVIRFWEVFKVSRDY